jgi:D-alanyl-D-alanine carboxypeptidase
MSSQPGVGDLDCGGTIVSTRAQQLPQRIGRPQRRALPIVAAVLLLALGLVGARWAFFTDAAGSRPELQRVLDGLVVGGTAPGATAYVTGPRGTWSGSAGLEDVETSVPMAPDSRMRIESNSKTWLVAVILQLAQESKLSLDDTVARWLPGLLRGHGAEITIRELLYDASGLIDDNDVYHATAAERAAMFARVGDPSLRAALAATAARADENPFLPVPALLFIRLAAWQPLVAVPGTTYHHSNIGWNVAGLIAAKAGGKPLPVLYRERIFTPLHLHATVFSPQGPIEGQHASGYARDRRGRLVDTTAMHPGKFADGAIVTNAKEEATFLRAAMDGTLFRKQWWADLYGAPGGGAGCGRPAYEGEGGGDGYRSYVLFDAHGGRIAVLLLNGNQVPGGPAAIRALYCAS